MGIYRGNAVFSELGAVKVLPMLVGSDWCPPDSKYCHCTGDDDCNNMFTSGACGPEAVCQINSANIPKCVCKTAGIVSNYSAFRKSNAQFTRNIALFQP
jgi:hypothetical protein